MPSTRASTSSVARYDAVDLIRRVRTDANDMVEPYFWSDQDVADWLNDAVREAAVRGRLIHEPGRRRVPHRGGRRNCRLPAYASLYELSHLGFYPADMSRPTMPVLKSAEVLDVELPEWRACTGKPLYAIQGDTSLRLVPTPTGLAFCAWRATARPG